MNRILFAAALAALCATGASADDKPAVVAAPPAPVVTAAPTVEMAPAMSTGSGSRRGLLSRLRDRRGGNMTSAPTMGAPVMKSGPVMTPPPAMAPMPMPGTTAPVPMPMPGKTTGTLTPAGGTVATGDVVTAGYSEPATTGTMRRGLFSRMRNR
jgi:hypothetical protein